MIVLDTRTVDIGNIYLLLSSKEQVHTSRQQTKQVEKIETYYMRIKDEPMAPRGIFCMGLE